MLYKYKRTFFRRAVKRDAKTVASWDIKRIIPCHGVSELSLHCTCWSKGSRMSSRKMAERPGGPRIGIFSFDLSLRRKVGKSCSSITFQSNVLSLDVCLALHWKVIQMDFGAFN